MRARRGSIDRITPNEYMSDAREGRHVGQIWIEARGMGKAVRIDASAFDA
jgi:hypothetical protein